MLFLSGIRYMPSGQCPGYRNEAYSWDMVVYVISDGFVFPGSSGPALVAVPGAGGKDALLG